MIGTTLLSVAKRKASFRSDRFQDCSTSSKRRAKKHVFFCRKGSGMNLSLMDMRPRQKKKTVKAELI
ncbi:Uncharacterised protein [Paenibacillus macerans]|uniref:Uncharacterized protein n=1 Tax=Paenibacillus macerans TaxID=44252 RepID=A0A090ZNY6_PAEMA|nr:hypothetical protein DJ90_2054 [Paenibacillus macerans]SUA84438.1 Uncharacterised protein [Paenibacillus macerans]